jgi:hypothetical protein
MTPAETVDRVNEVAEALRRQGHIVGPAPWYRVTRSTAAALLGVSEKTLRNRASQRLPPDYRVVLRGVWYSLPDLLAFMAVDRAA